MKRVFIAAAMLTPLLGWAGGASAQAFLGHDGGPQGFATPLPGGGWHMQGPDGGPRGYVLPMPGAPTPLPPASPYRSRRGYQDSFGDSDYRRPRAPSSPAPVYNPYRRY